MAGEDDETTDYPGYIRTPIHQGSAGRGGGLEGVGPAEPLESAVAALVKAALSEKPYRDLATSRQGAAAYAVLRQLPRRVLDRVTLKRVRASVARGHFDNSEMAASLRKRLETLK